MVTNLRERRTARDINLLFTVPDNVFSLILDGHTKEGHLYQIGVSEGYDGQGNYTQQSRSRPLVFLSSANDEGKALIYVGRRLPEELPVGESDEMFKRVLAELLTQKPDLDKIVQQYVPGVNLHHDKDLFTCGGSGPVLAGVLPNSTLINDLVKKVTVVGSIAQNLGLTLDLVHYEV